jgi:hypothetical protein
MKLPYDAVIAPEKIKEYLLTHRVEDDKSLYLEQAGYSLNSWYSLERDLREQILPKEAMFVESTLYGDIYEIRSELVGPNGTTLRIATIWMKEFRTGTVKFITLFPDKG